MLLFLENNYKFLLLVAAAEMVSKYFWYAKHYVKHFIWSSLLISRGTHYGMYYILFHKSSVIVHIYDHLVCARYFANFFACIISFSSAQWPSKIGSHYYYYYFQFANEDNIETNFLLE